LHNKQHDMKPINRFNSIWTFMGHYKYLIVIVIGVVVVGIVDDNSFMKRINYEFQINDLKDQINKYNTQYMNDSRKLWELNRNPKAIEKIAREEYFMKADNEDIFVLSDDEKPINQDETTK
jgi:cell division protein DivIC